MGWIVLGLIAVIIALLWYIHRLREEIRCYQHTWVKIEEISDHNQDGDVVIHIKHK